MTRNCVKYGELQVKSQKKSGTLLRKKKYVYEDEQWVAFCIHDDKVPLLEWYCNEASVAEHEPVKVQDLFGCLFVNLAICDDRCFIIGFTDHDRPAIELSAANAQECNEWVHEISSALKRLNYFDESENIYSELPLRDPDRVISAAEEKRRSRNSDRNSHPSVSPPPLPPVFLANVPVASPSPSTRNRVLCLSDKIPMQPTCSSGELESEEISAKKSVSTSNVSSTCLKLPLKLQQQICVKESDQDSSEQLEEYPPPLPPRKLNSLPCSSSPTNSCHNSIAIASPGSFDNSHYVFTNSPLSNLSMLSMRNEIVETNTVLEPFYNLLSFTNNKKTSFDTQEVNEEIEKEELRTCSSCKTRSSNPTGISSPESRNSTESQLVQDYQTNHMDMSPHLPHLQKRLQYDFPSSPPPPTIKDPFDTFRETLSRPKT